MSILIILMIILPKRSRIRHRTRHTHAHRKSHWHPVVVNPKEKTFHIHHGIFVSNFVCPDPWVCVIIIIIINIHMTYFIYDTNRCESTRCIGPNYTEDHCSAFHSNFYMSYGLSRLIHLEEKSLGQTNLSMRCQSESFLIL